jgi:hypothetical protein
MPNSSRPTLGERLFVLALVWLFMVAVLGSVLFVASLVSRAQAQTLRPDVVAQAVPPPGSQLPFTGKVRVTTLEATTREGIQGKVNAWYIANPQFRALGAAQIARDSANYEVAFNRAATQAWTAAITYVLP